MLGTRVVGNPRFASSPASVFQRAAAGPSAPPLTTMKNLAFGAAAALRVRLAASVRYVPPRAKKPLRPMFHLTGSLPVKGWPEAIAGFR